MKEVTCLGHKLNRYGVKPAEQKVQTNWPVPTSVKEVQVFLDAVGWYRKFIKKFSTVARPFTRLLEKEVKFKKNKTIDTPKIVNILFNVSTRLQSSCRLQVAVIMQVASRLQSSCRLLVETLNKMLTIFGVSIVLFFLSEVYMGGRVKKSLSKH